MKSTYLYIQRFLFFAVTFLALNTNSLLAQGNLLSDSSLSIFSVKDLVKIRKVLAKEQEQLLEKQGKIRETGVEMTQEFLGKSKEENSNQDKILIRVAEYLIEEEELDFERQFDRFEVDYQTYEKNLQAFKNGALNVEPTEPVQPQQNYQRSIAIYDLIIRNFPGSDLVDDAYYNKAFLLEKMDEKQAASQIFQSVIDEYPESDYAPEAYMKLAESFFYPDPDDDTAETILKLNKAIQLYKNVLQYRSSPRYDEALYKLGWSYYRLAGENPEKYTDAITYFMGVVKDIEKLQDIDPSGEMIRADVQPEALEFIAASFIDPAYSKSGVKIAKTFLEKLGKPSYGASIMANMGDRYAKITKWDDAIEAYRQLLEMYSNYIYAPRIQKKIADAYIAYENYDKAYQERKILFENYNPKSEWYANLEDQEIYDKIAALDEAYTLTEEGFRTNIIFLYDKAMQQESEKADVKSEFEEFVHLCKLYLENFPTDNNAYEINWAFAYVLDTRLKRFSESFTEYIRVSNDYLETNHQFDAAINAINNADTLVKLSRKITGSSSEPNPAQIGDDQLSSRKIQDLNAEEKMLAEAYDNFIKLFPNSAQTPSVLAAAGALYYNKRKYDLAKKYYKTMVTKFPEAQQKSVGLVSLMNSYFFLGQYSDAEIVAKKILESPDIPEDQIKIARSRVGESIYKNGERLEQEGNHFEAAKEYRRVYDEASENVTFVDLALFKSARNFEQSNEWIKAIETYEILVTKFTESKQVMPAYINIASDYKELEDFINVAKTNERIFEQFPGTQEAENALYNASLFYERAQSWSDAIRANNTYISTYPNKPESKDLLFENAKYYLKLDDLANANQIYSEFATRYPNDPLTVEAFYNRGVYYLERSSSDSAKVEFNKSIQKSNDFARAGRDPNLYYAAESSFKLGQIIYQEYLDIKLSYPQSTLRAQLERKQRKLSEVEKNFTHVIGLGSLRSFEAMYKIAEAYEEFANSIAYQKLPDDLTNDKRLVQENQVFGASVPAYDRAVEEYKNVLINLPVLAKKLEVNMDTTKTFEEPEESPAEESDLTIQKETVVDSSSEIALKWYNSAKEKISRIQYTVAEKSSEFITKYLRVENPNTGLRALVFKDQVLRQLIAPQVKTTIDAHIKTLKVATELNLKNKYVDESKRKVLLARNILAQEYENLLHQTGEIYRESIPVLEDLIIKGESAKTPDGLDYYDYQESYLMQLIYNMNEYSQIALNQYKITLQIAKDNNITNDAKITTEQKMFNFGYEAGVLLKDKLSLIAKEKSEFFLGEYDTTNNENYQLGSTFFDDQSFELSDYSQQIFASAYDLSKESGIENIWTRLILAKLVEIDPATYLTDLPKQDFAVSSDKTWLATTQYMPGWNYEDFNDSGWENALEVNLPFDIVFKVFDSLQVAPGAIWSTISQSTNSGSTIDNPLEILDQVEPDSVSNNELDTNFLPVEEPDTLKAYFRKTINLPAKPIDGWIAITADKAYYLYINDAYITGSDGNKFEDVEIVSFQAISEILKPGENLISASVTDFDGKPRYGLKFYMLLKLVPEDISNTIKKIREGFEQDAIEPKLFQKSAILNKNRIVE